MSTYTVRVWNNTTNPVQESGSMGEYDMATERAEVGRHEDVWTSEQVQFRLLESININLASIAETLERIYRDSAYSHNH